MTCPKCNNNNEETANYCIYCGANIKETSNMDAINNINNNVQTKTILNKNLKNSKNKIILIVIIVAIISIISIVILILNNNKISENSNNNNSNINTSEQDSNFVYESDTPIRFSKDNKYGFMDINGNVIIEPIYKSANEFEDSYKDYTYVSYDDSKSGYSNTIAYLIDKKGNIKATGGAQSDFRHITDYNVWLINDQLYDEELNKITSDDLKVYYEGYGYFTWKNNTNKTEGVMNSKGEITYTYQLLNDDYSFTIHPSDNDHNLKDNYGVAIVNNKKYAIINLDTGKIIVDYTDAHISCENYNRFEIIKNYDFDSRLYIFNDEIVFKSNNKSSTIEYNNNYITIYDSDNEEYTYYDAQTGKKLNEKPKTEIPKYSTELEQYLKMNVFSCDEGKGFESEDGIKIPCEWDSIDILMELNLYKKLERNGKSYIFAEKDNKKYLLNINTGKVVAKFNAKHIHFYSDSPFIYYKDEDLNKTIVYNLITGKSISVENEVTIYQKSESVIIEAENKKDYYNMNMKLIYTEE